MKAPLHHALLPLLDGYGAAWELVDGALAAELGEGPLVLRDGMDRAGLGALRVDLAAKLEGVRAWELEARGARGFGEVLREAVLARLKQCNKAARVWWGRSALGAAVPEAVQADRALDRFLRPVRDALRLWERLDGGPAPAGVVLPLTVGGDGFGRAGMQGLVDRLLGARDVEEGAEFELKIARAERDAVEVRARVAMSGFLQGAVARLGPGHPALLGAPRLYPLPGHTPAAGEGARGVGRGGGAGSDLVGGERGRGALAL